jgi:hypothetical protein
MDINTIPQVNEDAGRFVHFRDPANTLLFDVAAAADAEASSSPKKTPVGAVVSGAFSQYYLDATIELERQAGEFARLNPDASPEEQRAIADRLDYQREAACIRSWTFTADGKPFPITGENFAALCRRQPQWRGAVRRQIHDHASFFAAS